MAPVLTSDAVRGPFALAAVQAVLDGTLTVVRFAEAGGFDADALALHQAVDAALAGFAAFPFGGDGHVGAGVVGGFGVRGDVALEVAQDELLGAVRQHVVGRDRDLAAAAGGVHDVGGHAVAAGVAAQALHDLQALANGGAQVAGAVHEVALVDVVGAHADLHEFPHEFLHDDRVVVHTAQQHALVPEGHAGAGEAVAGVGDFRGDFLGVVHVDVHPHGVVLGEGVAQFLRDAHGHEHGDAGADADDLDVGDLAQFGEQAAEHLGRQSEGVAAGEQHVAHLGGVAQVIELEFVLVGFKGLGGVAHDAAAGAVAAVTGALRGDEHQHAVRVAVHQAGHGAVLVLGQAVFHHAGERLEFFLGGDHLAAHRAGGVFSVHQAGEVRGDVQAEDALGTGAFAFTVGQPNHFFEFGDAVDAVFQLPLPVVPLLVGHVRPFGGAVVAGQHVLTANGCLWVGRSGHARPPWS